MNLTAWIKAHPVLAILILLLAVCATLPGVIGAKAFNDWYSQLEAQHPQKADHYWMEQGGRI